MTRARDRSGSGRPFELAQAIVCPGPLLLADVERGQSWSAHRERLGPVPTVPLMELVAWCRRVGLYGRGGAGFPFAVKLATASQRRAVVVVNAIESEPASAKDAALLTRAPHLVLDGAALAATALDCQQVHVVVNANRPEVESAVQAAIRGRQRAGERLRWRVHQGSGRFVGGHASAVLELIAGRDDVPITRWEPEAVRGHRGRPTLLSNAETFAQLAALARFGPDDYAAMGHPGSPGTVLLTIDGDSSAPLVAELPGGAPLLDAIGTRWTPGAPVLLGGYHGQWLAGADVPGVRLCPPSAGGPSLGAGVVLPLTPATCPVQYTDHVVRFLAAESAGQCGPCRLGLPELARQVSLLTSGEGSVARVAQLAGLVEGRGACAHPDGTARLVASMLTVFDDEVAEHARGSCAWTQASLGAQAYR
jgi:NADH:ubiquinone oxidoreductase subunit F (NADH-binding)